MLPTTHKKKNKKNKHTTHGWQPISNLPRSTCQPLEPMMKLKDSAHNLNRNFLNKHLTKLKPKDATTNRTTKKSLQQKLRNHVRTDKSNSFRTASKSNHCGWAEGHTTKSAEEVPREKLAEVKEHSKRRHLGTKKSCTTEKGLNIG